MLRLPVIGITCDVWVPRGKPEAYELRLDQRYARAVKDAGGLPLLLPIAKRSTLVDGYLERIQGVVIVGGDDVDPHLYGERRRRKTRPVFEPRITFERALYQEARRAKVPIFGVCYGMQLINVLEGGTLHQDIARDTDATLDHADRRRPDHRVRIVPGSLLHRILERRQITVESEHHQAVAHVAPGFRPVAFATDGIVEAIECDSKSILAVQWHPERMLRSNSTRRLFRWYVDLCARQSGRAHRRKDG